MGYEVQIGPHTMVFEDPDLHILTFRGEIRGEDVERINGFSEAGLDPDSYQLILIDVSALEHVHASARRAKRRVRRKNTRYFYAVVGASYTVRVGIEMFARAVNLLSGWQRMSLRAFQTQAEARAWLFEAREELQRQQHRASA